MDASNTITTPNSKQQKTRLNYSRGGGFALLFGVVGFAAPILLFLLFTVLCWLLNGSSEFDRKYDLCGIPDKLIFPAIGTAWVFAGTGWTVFASRGKRRFLQTLTVMVLISIPSWYLLAGMGMSPTRYKGIDHPLIYPSEILLVAIPPSLTSLVISMKDSKRQYTEKDNPNENG
jgi:hypothetical protein